MLVATADEVVTSGGDGESLLTPVEQARADTFRRQQDRRDFIAAHILVRIAAGQLLGEPACNVRIVQRCQRCGGPHGRPAIPGQSDVHLSMAHTRGSVAAAAAPCVVGVDIERVGNPPLGIALYRHVLSAGEMDAVGRTADPHRAFLRLWVRKEALVKIGVTTLDRMSEADLTHLPLEEPNVRPRTSPLGPSWPELYLCDWVDERRGIVGAAVGSRPPKIVVFNERAPAGLRKE